MEITFDTKQEGLGPAMSISSERVKELGNKFVHVISECCTNKEHLGDVVHKSILECKTVEEVIYTAFKLGQMREEIIYGLNAFSGINK